MFPNSNLISFNSASPARRSASPHKSPPPQRSPTPEKHTNGKDSPLSRSVSPSPKRASSHSPGSDGKVRLVFNCWLFIFLPMHLFMYLTFESKFTSGMKLVDLVMPKEQSSMGLQNVEKVD
jgi:hypothetical protein